MRRVTLPSGREIEVEYFDPNELVEGLSRDDIAAIRRLREALKANAITVEDIRDWARTPQAQIKSDEEN